MNAIRKLITIQIQFTVQIEEKKGNQQIESDDIPDFSHDITNTGHEAETVSKSSNDKGIITLENTKEQSEKDQKLDHRGDIGRLHYYFRKEMENFGKRSRKENIAIASLFFLSGMIATWILQYLSN